MRILSRLPICLLLLLTTLLPPGHKVFAETTAVGNSGNGQKIALDFNDVDIITFVKYISELTGKNFIVDPSVKGKVTVISPSKLNADEAYKVFESVLEVYGYTTVAGEDVIKIVPVASAREKNIVTLTRDSGQTSPEQMVTRIFRLRYGNPDEFKTILSSFVPKSSAVVSYPPTKMLIVTDVATNISRLSEIIDQIDIPASNQELLAVQLKNGAATSVGKVLDSMFSQEKNADPKAMKVNGEVKVIPYDRLNMLFIFAPAEDHPRIKDIIAMLDAETKPETGNLHVYYLQNANAAELSQVLTSLPTQQAAQAGGERGKQAVFSEEVKISADKATNSLLIIANKHDYEVLKDVIQKLDIPRKMVYIEALIMEVNVEKNFELGVDWRGGASMNHSNAGWISGFSGTNPEYQALNDLGQAALPPGFALGVFSKGITIGSGENALVFPNIGALLHAYKNADGVHILSTPQILTTDNEEARIYVGENVPYQTKEGTGDQNYSTYEYRDVGVTLKITPQINQDGMVRLKIYQEVLKLKSNDQFRPTTLKRTAETTVVVENTDTVVIGGIIGNDKNEGEVKIPVLGQIPVLGRLFRYDYSHDNLTNLYIFITPYVNDRSSEMSELQHQKKEFMDKEMQLMQQGQDKW